MRKCKKWPKIFKGAYTASTFFICFVIKNEKEKSLRTRYSIGCLTSASPPNHRRPLRMRQFGLRVWSQWKVPLLGWSFDGDSRWRPLCWWLLRVLWRSRARYWYEVLRNWVLTYFTPQYELISEYELMYSVFFNYIITIQWGFAWRLLVVIT